MVHCCCTVGDKDCTAETGVIEPTSWSRVIMEVMRETEGICCSSVRSQGRIKKSQGSVATGCCRPPWEANS